MIINNTNTTAPPSYRNHAQYPPSYHNNQPPQSYHINTTLPGYHRNTTLPSYNEAILSPDETDINVYQPPPQDGAVSNIQPEVVSTEAVDKQWIKKIICWIVVIFILVVVLVVVWSIYG